MTLDDAIKHCQQVAKESDCGECANEHKQLAQWLQELKEFKKMQTNEEWLRTATTEQLAGWIFNILLICSRCGDESQSDKEKIKKCPFRKIGCTKKDWEMWLKQPHTPKE